MTSKELFKKTSYGKMTVHNIIIKYYEKDTISVTNRSGCSKKVISVILRLLLSKTGVNSLKK